MLDPNSPSPDAAMTPERTGTIGVETVRGVDGLILDQMRIHLLRFQEVLDACRQKRILAQLTSLEFDIYRLWPVDCRDSRRTILTRFVAKIEDGTLWVNLEDVKQDNARGESNLWV